MTSAQKGGGKKKYPKFVEKQYLYILRTEMGKGSKNVNTLWSSYMEAPFVKFKSEVVGVEIRVA